MAIAGTDRSVTGGGGRLLCRAWPRVRGGHEAALGPSLSGFSRRCGDWTGGGDPAEASLGRGGWGASFSRIPSGAVGPCMGRVCDVSTGQCQLPKEVLSPAGIKCIRVRMNQADWRETQPSVRSLMEADVSTATILAKRAGGCGWGACYLWLNVNVACAYVSSKPFCANTPTKLPGQSADSLPLGNLSGRWRCAAAQLNPGR